MALLPCARIFSLRQTGQYNRSAVNQGIIPNDTVIDAIKNALGD